MVVAASKILYNRRQEGSTPEGAPSVAMPFEKWLGQLDLSKPSINKIIERRAAQENLYPGKGGGAYEEIIEDAFSRMGNYIKKNENPDQDGRVDEVSLNRGTSFIAITDAGYMLKLPDSEAVQCSLLDFGFGGARRTIFSPAKKNIETEQEYNLINEEGEQLHPRTPMDLSGRVIALAVINPPTPAK